VGVPLQKTGVTDKNLYSIVSLDPSMGLFVSITQDVEEEGGDAVVIAGAVGKGISSEGVLTFPTAFSPATKVKTEQKFSLAPQLTMLSARTFVVAYYSGTNNDKIRVKMGTVTVTTVPDGGLPILDVLIGELFLELPPGPDDVVPNAYFALAPLSDDSLTIFYYSPGSASIPATNLSALLLATDSQTDNTLEIKVLLLFCFSFSLSFCFGHFDSASGIWYLASFSFFLSFLFSLAFSCPNLRTLEFLSTASHIISSHIVALHCSLVTPVPTGRGYAGSAQRCQARWSTACRALGI
jgi:hypothetical protein